MGTDAGSSPVLRYNININSGVEDGNANVTIDGNIIGGKTYTFSDLKSRLGGINTANLPLGLSIGSLRVNGESYDYNEDVNTLTFSRSFTTDQRIDVNGIFKTFTMAMKPLCANSAPTAGPTNSIRVSFTDSDTALPAVVTAVANCC